MAKATRMGLFVDRFVAFNLNRYTDDPVMKPLFTGLTEGDLVFEALTGTGTAKRSVTVKSTSRNFIGLNQTWTAAEVNDANGFDLAEPGTLADLAAVKAKTVPGVYAYFDTDGTTVKIAVLLAFDTAPEAEDAAALAAFDTAFRVTLQPADFTATAGVISVDAPTVHGSVVYALATEAVHVIPDTDYGQLTFPEAGA